MLDQVFTALVGFGCLAAAVPTVPVARHRNGGLNQTNFVNGGNGFAGIDQLAQLAEADLLAQVQSQLLLSAELQAIKDNIRINSLKARFPQVNTVLVTVTNVIDARNPVGINNRYLLNQLLVDNGFPNQQQVIMVTESQTYTITETASSTTESATSTLDLGSLASAATATPTASSLTLPLVTGAGGLDLGLGLSGIGIGQGAASVIQQQTTVTTFNPLSGIPVSFLNNPQALLLPYDTAAPSSPFVFEDPANIIYGGVNGLLVQGLSSLQADCAAFGLGGNAFLGGAAGLGSTGVFSSLQQAVSFQLTSIQVGGATQVIPPSILLAHPDLAGALRVNKATGTATVEAEASATAAAEATSSAAH
ncbi:hypothetical protein B0T16DRAFT_390693 [Cercophora newfieldiana]|uniref:Uncharacterized protein n=1 Tax=Cercophora newfieldiana TaxID=92897 RepID=A0AA40CPG6_9PEZI|nr:hypothetical protein B0T16DRAFT_390693 [Cercophora newfieldiana]